MNKLSVIKALQVGLEEALTIIKHQYQKDLVGGGSGDPQIFNTIQQLEQLLKYSEHIHDEHPANNHPIYGN